MGRPRVHLEVREQWGANIAKARHEARSPEPPFGPLYPRQRDLGDVLRVSQATVCRWETGEVVPNDADKVALANALGRSVDELFPLSRGVRIQEPAA